MFKLYQFQNEILFFIIEDEFTFVNKFKQRRNKEDLAREQEWRDYIESIL